MIAKVRPDIVTIATRTPGRVDIIAAAAAEGVKALYVEKPLSQNLSGARRAEAAVQVTQVTVEGDSVTVGVELVPSGWPAHGLQRAELWLCAPEQVAVSRGLPGTIEVSNDLVRVRFAGATIVDAAAAMVMREDGHAPVYYFPRDAVRMDLLSRTTHSTR